MSAQKIQTKTISTLDRKESTDSGDLYWISRREGADQYSSYSVDLTAIVAAAESKTISDMETAFGLAGMDVSNIKNRVDQLYDSSVTIKGVKTFQEAPLLSNYNGTEDISTFPDNMFTVKGNVEKIIADGGSFIGDNSSITPFPNNDTPLTNEDEDLMIWRIPEGKSDSTEYADEYGFKNREGVECAKTGQLVVYGWLADGGGVLPQEAWVAIYGKIENAGADARWTILQLQPWSVSDRSKVIQYVGFNIPVKEGLYLKIKTGFKVSSSATATNSGNSLTFPNVQPNTLVGYIIA